MLPPRSRCQLDGECSTAGCRSRERDLPEAQELSSGSIEGTVKDGWNGEKERHSLSALISLLYHRMPEFSKLGLFACSSFVRMNCRPSARRQRGFRWHSDNAGTRTSLVSRN